MSRRSFDDGLYGEGMPFDPTLDASDADRHAARMPLSLTAPPRGGGYYDDRYRKSSPFVRACHQAQH